MLEGTPARLMRAFCTHTYLPEAGHEHAGVPLQFGLRRQRLSDLIGI